MSFLNPIKGWRLGLFYSALALGAWDTQGVQTIQVGAARQVPPTMIGANTITRDQLSNIAPWADPQSLADLVKTGMSVMRYPGGTYGNYFDWNEGRPYNKTTATHRYLPEHTKVATDALDGKTLWMVNVLMEPKTDIVAALSNAVNQGCEVKCLELGNEFYFSSFDPSSSSYDPTYLGNGWTNGTAYGIDMNGWIATLKAKFPDAVISLPFDRGINNSSTTRRAQWNAKVAAACTNYDAITIHVYTPSLIDLGYGPTTVASNQTSQWNYFTGDSNAVKLVLGSPREGWSNMVNHVNFWIPTNKPIWFTEFGVDPDTTPWVFKGTWADGLADFVLYHTLLSHPQAAMATEQQYIDLNHGGPNEFSNVKINVGQNLSGTLGTLTAEGHVFRALANAARDKELISILSFGGAYTVSPPGIASYPALCGMMFSDSTNANAVIANISDQPQEISTASLGPAGANVTLISVDHFYTFVVTSNDVHYTNFTMGATIALPPFTLCTVSGLNRTLATGGEKYTPKFSGTHVPVYASDDMAYTRPIARDVADQNAGDVLSYSLSGTNPVWVAAAGTNGLHFDPAPIGSYKAYVRVGDSSGLSDYATFDITVIDGSANSDGDAYSNDEELLLGTNPLLTDTDGDGYSDSDDAYPLDPTRHAVFPQVTIDQKAGATFGSTPAGATVTVGTFTAQTNDVLVFVAGGSNSNHINSGAVAWVSTNGGALNASTLFKQSSVGIWYTKVTAGGTFNVNFTITNNITTVGAYLLHATAGKALKISTNGMYLAGAATNTNAALTYNFGTASEGVVIECMSTYSSGGATPSNVTVDYSNGVPMKRIAGSGTFSNLTALSTSWTVVQTPTNGNVNVAGIAVYTDYVDLSLNYALTVNSGSGSGGYINGTQVGILPTEIVGKTFAQWTGDTQYLASAATVASNTVTMPAQAIVLTATYTDAEQYTASGTPYSWLTGYGLTNYNTDAAIDQDQDGLAAWQEYIAGTDPTNAASCLLVTEKPRDTVTWSPVTGRIYSVYWSTNLVQGFTNLADNIVHPQGSYTNATPDPRVNYYRVRVLKQ